MPSAAGLAPLGLNVTKSFSTFFAAFRFDDLPEAAVQHHGAAFNTGVGSVPATVMLRADCA